MKQIQPLTTGKGGEYGSRYSEEALDQILSIARRAGTANRGQQAATNLRIDFLLISSNLISGRDELDIANSEFLSLYWWLNGTNFEHFHCTTRARVDGDPGPRSKEMGGSQRDNNNAGFALLTGAAKVQLVM